jgi:DUF971 family protein
MNQQQQPEEIRINAEKTELTATFNGTPYTLSAEYLRVESPSAEVKGHGDAPKKTVSGKQGITLKKVEPVGHYALQITFADGHRTGIYTWDYLYELATEKEQKWQAYLNSLFKLGLSRKPNNGDIV